MTIGANETEIYLAIFPLFGLGQPPLEIPYTHIQGKAVGLGLFTQVELTFGEEQDAAITITKAQADRFEAASQHTWHYERS